MISSLPTYVEDTMSDGEDIWHWTKGIFNREDLVDLVNRTNKVYRDQEILATIQLELSVGECREVVLRWHRMDQEDVDWFNEWVGSFCAWLEAMMDNYNPDWRNEDNR